MTKIDDVIAKQIGDLVLTSIKQRATIEQLAAQVQQLTAENERLKADAERGPELPLPKKPDDGKANGRPASH